MRPTDTKSMIEGALLAAITIILSIISLYMPVLGVFASLVWPVPIVILGVRHGLRISILSTIVAGIFVAILSGPLQAFTVVFGFGLIGIVMGWAIKKDFSPFKVLIMGGIASLISKIVLVGLSLLIMGINPLTEEISMMKESLSTIGNMYKGMGASPEMIKSTIEQFGNALDLMALVLPGILIIASFMDSFLTYQVTKAVLSRLGQKMMNLTPFWQWQLPIYTVPVFLLGKVFTMLEVYWPKGVFNILGLNIMVIFSIAFFIQGFAVLAYFMAKWNVSKVLRVLIVFLVFFNPIFAQIIFWAGMFDILFNFRHI